MIATYPETNAKKLNVRESPNGPVKRTLEPGAVEAVEIIEGGWCKLSDGWCRADLVTVTDGLPDAQPAEQPADEQEGTALDKMTKARLIDLAEQSGIEVDGDMRKADIIAAILNG